MNNYVVGQVVYVILRKEAAVYPVQIVEEITKKSLNGEETTYMVKTKGDVDYVVALSEIDGEVFESAEDAKSVLIKRVSTTISKRVDEAVDKAKLWYPNGFISKPGNVSNVLNGNLPMKKAPSKEVAEQAVEFAKEAEDTATVVELPDGTKAKVKSVKLPGELQG